MFVVCTRIAKHFARGSPTLNIRFHANATITPKTRAHIQSSEKSIRALAEELGVSVSTVLHWRNSETIHDDSHTRKIAGNTQLRSGGGFYPTTVDGLVKRPDLTARVTDEKLARTSRRGGVFIGSWSTEPPIVFWEIPSTTKDVVGY